MESVGSRRVMASGGTSWSDLALCLIACLSSVDEAMYLAKHYLIDWHAASQRTFAMLVRTRQTEDGAFYGRLSSGACSRSYMP
ncbi:hypothetical protein [Halomonas sp. DQ26W]|uniref:hypothetical protein n=1 Tax=Halomonas sp. DQ26W TaxID=2282311 RepID=UPI0015F12220|nr:hypothetical protein [Halomonas sp. DQ26W]